MITFKIKTEYIELMKLLKLVNLCTSGGEAKHVISSGLVRYNGVVDTRKRLKVRPGDEIEFAGETVIVEKTNED
jgi:ribosome-associated protein